MPAAGHVVALRDARQGVAVLDDCMPSPVPCGRRAWRLAAGLRRGASSPRSSVVVEAPEAGAAEPEVSRDGAGPPAVRPPADAQDQAPGPWSASSFSATDDLLVLGGQVGAGGVLLAAGRGPAGLRELQAAVVAVAGVDVTSCRRTRTGRPRPRWRRRRPRRRWRRSAVRRSRHRRHRRSRRCGRPWKRAGGHDGALPWGSHPHRRLRGQLSGSGVSCPAARRPGAHDFTPSRFSAVRATGVVRHLAVPGGEPWVPRSCLRRFRVDCSRRPAAGLGVPGGRGPRWRAVTTIDTAPGEPTSAAGSPAARSPTGARLPGN